jgi:hypothetical protein|eukprot:COSAG01_NODE_1271_length_10961_cov_555.935739_3_plen_103_part_00
MFQTVDHTGGALQTYMNPRFPMRRDAVTVNGVMYSGGFSNCRYQGDTYNNWGGVCNGCPPVGTALAAGQTITWNSGTSNGNDYQSGGLTLNTGSMGWELCFA